MKEIRTCAFCGRPVTGRRGKALLCLDCHAAGRTMHDAPGVRRRYKDSAKDGGLAFKRCEDCKTCKKTACRHHPENPEKQKNQNN